jgi:hypothetical protein
MLPPFKTIASSFSNAKKNEGLITSLIILIFCAMLLCNGLTNDLTEKIG